MLKEHSKNLTNDEAIELAKRAIAPCKGETLRALQLVIAMAERYNETIDRTLNYNGAALRTGVDGGGAMNVCPLYDNVNRQCTACDVACTIQSGERAANSGYSTLKKSVSCNGLRERCEDLRTHA